MKRFRRFAAIILAAAMALTLTSCSEIDLSQISKEQLESAADEISKQIAEAAGEAVEEAVGAVKETEQETQAPETAAAAPEEKETESREETTAAKETAAQAVEEETTAAETEPAETAAEVPAGEEADSVKEAEEKLNEAIAGYKKAIEEKSAPVYVIYTNDIHCAVDTNLGITTVATLKKTLESLGNNVILVDSGDAMQGGLIGTVNEGESVVRIMNEAGYEVYCIGNHDFGYGLDRLLEIRDKEAEYTMVSCNILDEDGKTVFEPYKIIESGGKKIAFIGVTTPETLTSTNPVNYKDEDGNDRISFCQDSSGVKLAQQLQKYVTLARREGADICIALAHLGNNSGCSPWTCDEIIGKVTGIDFVIDGHSHEVEDNRIVKDAEGKDVTVSQTGTLLNSIGVLKIASDGTITSALVSGTDITNTISEENAKIEEKAGEKLAKTDFDLEISDPEELNDDGTSKRIVRNEETNLGDLCADAVKSAGGSDIGIHNGGAVRSTIKAGRITFNDVMNIMPFSNFLCTVEMSGQELLDMLEVSVKDAPDEFGGFLQVSGITFDVDLKVKSPVSIDEKQNCVIGKGKRRVSNVKVNGIKLDTKKKYTVTGTDYILKDGGNGYGEVLKDVKVVKDDFIVDHMALQNYLTDELNGEVPDKYEDIHGEGRITIK